MKIRLKKTILLVYLIQNTLVAQNKVCFPVWTFHDDSTTIQGLSVGFNQSFNIQQVKVNGINIELFGLGIIAPLMPQSPVCGDSCTLKSEFQSDTVAMQINGINISPLGSICDCNINGVNINGMASNANITNGLSMTIFANFAQIANGIQFAFIGNDSAFMNGVQCSFYINVSRSSSRGVQIALFNDATIHNGLQIGAKNSSEYLHGIQLGLWNKNQKRSLPFINWNFKS
ncbi:MAG: hypothetical protein HY062_10445 [Bacteroidetes bacterium]|nr:hypothetical protein [Bacteroidota bacterium]